MVELEQYHLEEQLSVSAHTVVSRGRVGADGPRVIVKRPRDEYPEPRAVARLRHEFDILSSLGIAEVEEIVDRLDASVNACVLPSWVVTCVAHVPGGAHPSYAHGYNGRDNAFYKAWDAISRDRERFTAWMNRHVISTADFEEFRRSIASEQAAGQKEVSLA